MKIRLEHISVAYLSFCILFVELLETRLLSFIFWNHMVYLTISVALLGFGVSGTLVALFSERLLKNRSSVSWMIAGFGLTTGLIFFAAAFLPNLGWISSPVKILFCYTAFVFPFLFAGAALSTILSNPEFKVGQLYAIDLVSAGIGCFLFFFLLPSFGPPMLLAAVCLTSGLLAWRWADNDRFSKVGAAICSVFAVALFGIHTKIPILPEPYKELHDVLALPEAVLERTVWTPLCRIDVASDAKTPINMYTYDLPVASAKLITQDATANTILAGRHAITYILDRIKSDAPGIYAPALVYRIKSAPKVAIIGVGGGSEVVHAIGYGASEVVGAELNPVIYDTTTRRYADFNGHFFDNPKIKIYNQEGRSLLRQLGRKFDVVQVVAIDTFAALSSGAYVLSENYLYTVECMKEVLDHLQPDGVMSCMRWNVLPPRESLRLTSLACEALKQRGSTTIEKQIVIARQEHWALMMVKNGLYTPDEIKILIAAAKRHNIQMIYIPKVFGSAQAEFEENYYRGIDETTQSCRTAWNQLIESYSHNTEEKFFNSYPFRVSPTTDDSPFFFEYHQKNEALSGLNLDEQRGNTAGVTLNLVLIQSVLFTVFAIIMPLLKFKRVGMAVPHAGAFSLYFASVGFGFMLIEVALIQKCVLFLGSPMYSMSVVLATLLVSAGLGSGLTSKSGWSTKKLMTTVGPVFLCFFALLTFSLNGIIDQFLPLPLTLKMLITAAILFPSGLLLGVFFPTGLQSVQARGRGYLPWAWGINGGASVYGSFTAIKLAVIFGFTGTLLLGAASYALAILAGLKFSSDEPTTPTAGT